MASLEQAQSDANSQKRAETIFKKEELAKTATIFCVQGAEKKRTEKFGYQWEVTIFHANGQQKIWFVGCDPTDKNSKMTKWDYTFSSGIDWPAHSFRLIIENGKYYKFVKDENAICPCQDADVEEILAETMGEDAPATKDQMHAFKVLAASLKISVEDVTLTVAEWKSAMQALFNKQMGIA